MSNFWSRALGTSAPANVPAQPPASTPAPQAWWNSGQQPPQQQLGIPQGLAIGAYERATDQAGQIAAQQGFISRPPEWVQKQPTDTCPECGGVNFARHGQGEGTYGKLRRTTVGEVEFGHCLSGDTRVLTWDGYQPIADLSGRTVKIVTADKDNHSHWTKASFRSFGEQELWEISIRRNKIQKTIRATSGHRWFGRTSGSNPWREIITADLTPGTRLQASAIPMSRGPEPSPWGIAHGFTYGDGNLDRSTGAQVTLWGEKDEALRAYFPLSPEDKRETENGVQGIRIRNLPRFFKQLPDLDESPGYLYGWLAGYFAADGCVDESGQPILTSASRENLEFVRKVCIRLGIFTYGIRHQMRVGLGAAETPMYFLSFGRSSLSSQFFVISQHQIRWFNHYRTFERRGWTVDSVRKTTTKAEVFCAVVPGTHNFVLEDNLLTGNCFSCGFTLNGGRQMSESQVGNAHSHGGLSTGGAVQATRQPHGLQNFYTIQ